MSARATAEGHGTRVTTLALAPGEVWSGGGPNGLILIHSVPSAALLARAYTPHRADDDRVQAMTVCGGHVWVGENQGAIVVFSRETRRVVAEAEERHRGSVYAIVTGDANACWAGYADGSLVQWRLINPTASSSAPASLRIEVSTTLSAAVRALTLPSPSAPLWAALDDGSVHLVDSLSGRHLRTAGLGGDAPLLCLEACGGGRVVCGGSADGAVRFFDAPSGRLLGQVRGHQGRVTGLAYDAAPQQINESGVWSVSTDRTVRYWQCDQGLYDTTRYSPLEPCAGLLWAVASSPGALIVGNGEGILHMIPTTPSSSSSDSSALLPTLSSPASPTPLPTVAAAATVLPVLAAKSSPERDVEHQTREKERLRDLEAARKERLTLEQREADVRECEKDRNRERETDKERLRAVEAERDVLREQERERERNKEQERELRAKDEADRDRLLKEQTERLDREKEELRRLRAQLKETESELGAARAECRRLEQALTPPMTPTLLASPPPASAAVVAPSPLPTNSPASPAQLPVAPSTPSPQFSTTIPPQRPSPVEQRHVTHHPPLPDRSSSSPSLPNTYNPIRTMSSVLSSSPHLNSPSAPLSAAMAALNAERRALDARLDATCRQAAALRLV